MFSHPLSRYLRVLLLIGFVALTSCRVYNQNIMFRTGEDFVSNQLAFSKGQAEKNYVIRPNDYLDVQVYTNKGERILDPNGEFARSLGIVGGSSQTPASRASGSAQGTGQSGGAPGGASQFLVQHDGYVKLPMVGLVKLNGYSLLEADSILQEKYGEFYVDSYVLTRVTNTRIFVLGAGGGSVVPLNNENMNLIEVLALAGGIPENGKAYNIRLIRGDLDNPSVQVIDLSTIEGLRQASLQVEPNDIIYVEPVRRVLTEVLRDASPVLGIVSTLVTMYFWIWQISRTP